MKKLLSILLALTLTLSLSVPALAASIEEYPMDVQVTAWLEDHPEQAAAMEEGLDDWVKYSWGYNSVTEMAQSWGESEDYIRDLLLEEQVWAAMEQEAREAFLAEYEAAHPGFLDEFDPDAWFQAAYPYYLPPEESFMNDYGLTTRAEFEDFLKQDYVNHIMYMEDLQKEIDTWLAEDPTLLDGFDVNDYFAQEYSFYDSQEDFMADYTLVDPGEFETYLTWEYLAIYATPEVSPWGDADKEALGGVPGELGVMVNGTYLTFDNDKPYAEDGVTYVPAQELGQALGLELEGSYVPLRETAQAAGYDIWWDQAYETAVLIDPAALMEAIDGEFTVMNSFLAEGTPGWERWESAQNYELTLTLFDSLNGDQVYPMTLTQNSLYGPEGLQSTGSYDLSALIMILTGQLDGVDYTDGENMPVLEALLAGDYELRWDADSGSLAFTASCLPELMALAGSSVLEDLWITLDGASAQGLEDLIGQSQPASAGALVRYLYETTAADYTAPVFYWGGILGLAGNLAVFLGDDALIREGEAWVLRLDPADLAQLLGYGDGEDAISYLGLSQFSLECAFHDDGSLTGSVLILAPGDSWSPAARFTAQWDFDLEGGSLEAEFHIKNLMQLVLILDADQEATTERPETQPAEEDMKLDLEDVLSGV